MRPPRPRPPVAAQLTLGLVVVSLGVLFTLENLGVLYARDYLRYWPVIPLAIGVSQIVHARTSARVFGGAIWMLIGAVTLGRTLDVWRVSVWDLWPLFLVLAGGYIVWQAFLANDPDRTKGWPLPNGMPFDKTPPFVKSPFEPPAPFTDAPPPGDAPATEDAPPFFKGAPGATGPGTRVHGIAVMGGVERRIHARDFQGGEFTAFMGGCDVDLRDAGIAAGGPAVITVFALMGGVELKIPESWTVEVQVLPFLGGVEDKTRPPAGAAAAVAGAAAPHLIVRGFVMMGGIVLRN